MSVQKKKPRAKRPRAKTPGPCLSQRDAFLAAFASCGSVSKAAEAAGINRSLHYDWLEGPQYRRKFVRAKREAIGVLVDEAVRRAREGNKRVIFYKDEPIGVEFEYSDSLMMFLLRAWAPRVYGDKQKLEHSGPKGGPIDLIARLTAGRQRMAGLQRDEAANSV